MSPRPALPRTPTPAPRAQRGLLTLLLIVAAAVTALGLAVAGGVVAWLSTDLPALDKVTDYRPHLPLKVVTRDGVEIAQFGAERRLHLPLDRIPRRLQDAVIATEDARFREHTGLDLRGIARAVVSNVFAGRREGASTLTQQVARNFFLSHRRTWERKAKEALLALKIERELSKDEILELYLNQMYLGQRAYGVGAAAQVYYGKSVDQLSVAEMAMIAGLHQNPVYANPISNLERAVDRQRWVLQRMKATGVISEPEYQAALAEKPQVRSLLDVPVHAEHVAEMARQAVVERLGTDAAYTQGITVVTSLVAAEQQAAHLALRRALLAHEARQAWRGPEDQEDLPAGLPTDSPELEKAAAQALRTHRDDEDLRAAIVLEATPQAMVAQLATGELVRVNGEGLALGRPGLDPKAKPALALRRGAIVRLQWLPEGTARGGLATPPTPVIVGPAPAVAPPKPRVLRRDEAKGRWWLVQWPQAQGAVAALEPDTGRVRALVGGFDFGRSQFNHATQAWRQPGSSFKPFLYSAALESGVMPQTVVMDAPVTDAQGEPIPGWDPKNSDGQFDGPMTLRQALARSKNSVSIRLVQWMGVAEARAWTAQFGFDPGKHPDNLTLALGAGATTPLQLASAYAVIANGGLRTEARVVERITDARGAVLFEAPPPPPADESRRVVPARNAWLTAQLLQEVTRSGTAARAQGTLKRGDLYGKTGTTDDAVDAWFGGFQPGIAAAVWMGYPEPRSLGARESGGGLALPVWIELMATALRGVPVRELAPPDGVVPVDGDWRFEEWAGGGFVARLGVDEASQPVPVATGRGAALAASAPDAPPAVPTAPASDAAR